MNNDPILLRADHISLHFTLHLYLNYSFFEIVSRDVLRYLGRFEIVSSDVLSRY